MKEKDFTGPLERPSIAMYIEDLETTIRHINDSVFSSSAHPRVQIRIIDEFVEEGDWGLRVSRVASFADCSRLRSPRNVNVARLPFQKECYLLWSGGVESSITTMFHNGRGDAGLRELWYQSAVALVRARVLSRIAYFPHVDLRTSQSVRSHAGLFGPTIFAEIHKLPRILTPERFTAKEVDVHVTTALVLAGLASGMEEGEALRFLIT